MRSEQGEVKMGVKDYAICFGAATVIVGIDLLASIHTKVEDWLDQKLHGRSRLAWGGIHSDANRDSEVFLLKMRGILKQDD